VVDLSETTFMDSTGLGVLVNGVRQTGRRDGKLVVVCPTERIMRPFEITGLHNHLPIVKTRDEALAAF
jgi:anti-sigma B factor antagonist